MRPGESNQHGPHSGPRLHTWAKLGQLCLASGVVLMVTAAITKADSAFIWTTASACIGLAVVFLVVHLRANAPRPRSSPEREGARAASQRVVVLVLLVLLSIFGTQIKNGIEGIWSDPAATSGQAPAGIKQPIVNKLICPALLPSPYACRNGRCSAGGRYSR